MFDFILKYEVLDVLKIIEFLGDDSLGANVIFTGTVRNQSKKKVVVALEFEAYEPMAISELQKLVSEITSKWPIQKIVLHHRLGIVEVGETAVIAGISAVHRAEAFEACSYLMNRLKQTVPIWKKEIYADGSEWVTPNP